MCTPPQTQEAPVTPRAFTAANKMITPTSHGDRSPDAADRSRPCLDCGPSWRGSAGSNVAVKAPLDPLTALILLKGQGGSAEDLRPSQARTAVGTSGSTGAGPASTRTR